MGCTEMTNLVLALLFFTTFCAGCHMKLGLEGEIDIRNNDLQLRRAPKWMGLGGELEATALYMNRRRNGVTELVFTGLQMPANESINIYVNKYKKLSTWKFHTEIDSSSGPNVAIRFHTLTGLKMIFNMKDMYFNLSYAIYYCEVPEDVKLSNCTKSKLRGSKCSFACKSSEYMDLDPRTTRCKYDQTWTGNPRKHCSEFENVVKNCQENSELREDERNITSEESSIRDCITSCVKQKINGRYVIPCGPKK